MEKSALRLIVNQDDQEIQDYKLMNRVEYFACNSCGHRWALPLQDMVDDPTCRKCGK